MSFLSAYGLFLLKSLTLAVVFLLAVAGFFAIASQRKKKTKPQLVSLNKTWEARQHDLYQTMQKKNLPKKTRKQKKAEQARPSLFVLHFQGDIKASQVESLREEISTILSIASPGDEVMLNLESPGGAVNGYGLAAAQLQRLRDRNIPLTVCIDKIAASGGYLMACIANRIVAAPFAILGSIGVVAQLPNFHRLLQKNDIDIEMLTAGEYKRTLTLLAENTVKGRQKCQEDIEKIHTAFQTEVLRYRSNVDINEVASGAHWLGQEALDRQLVDTLQTSDDWILSRLPDFNIWTLTQPVKPSFIQRVLHPAITWLHPWG